VVRILVGALIYKLFRPVVKCSGTSRELKDPGSLKTGVVERPVEFTELVGCLVDR